MPNFETPSCETATYAAAMSAASSAGTMPSFEYTNVAGRYQLHEANGQADYMYFDGNVYHDKLSYLGRARVGQPDDDFHHIGFDSGYVYKVVNEDFDFLLSDVPFAPPYLDDEVFRLYSSEDARNWVRWKTLGGTRRVAVPPRPPEPPEPPRPPLSDEKVRQVEEAIVKILNVLAVGNEGKVDVSRREQALPLSTSTAPSQCVTRPDGSPFTTRPITFKAISMEQHPETAANINVCVGLPGYLGGGESCVTLAEVATVLRGTQSAS